MMFSPQFLETMNGTLLVIFLGVEFFFARYILLDMVEHGFWEGYKRRRAAAAVFLMIGGETLTRGWIWAWRHFSIPHDDQALTLGVNAGVAICIVGCVCVLRHFAPKGWGAWTWVGIPILGVAFGAIMALHLF